MSWVLILNSSYVQKPPAVIGGYPTWEAAEAAGDLATAFENKETVIGWYGTPEPYFTSYHVIPGAAAAAQTVSKSIHCHVERDQDGKLVRHKNHFRGPQ